MSQAPQPPYQGSGYGYAPSSGAPEVGPTNGKATASLVTGIASLVLSWCCGFGLVGIVAVVLGAKARKEIRAGAGAQEGDGLAIAGIVTGAIAAILGLLILVLIVVAVLAAGAFDSATLPRGTEL